MSIRQFVLLFCALGTYAGSCFSQTYLSVNFDQLAAPTGCLNSALPGTQIPALKLAGATISGGQVLSYANQYQSYNNVYATITTCAGVQPVITIAFDGPVSGLSMEVGNNWYAGASVQVADDTGETQSVSPSDTGTTVFFANNNIHQVTLTLTNPPWTPNTPAGFYIDSISCYLNEPLYFIDPVPSLITGTGVVDDPESLATMGTFIRGVAADGAARVLLVAPTGHVGDVVTFSVLGDRNGPGNSTQDGGVTSVNSSPGQALQSVRVASQDSSNGPKAFAIYYPPADFSRGPQDNSLASRTVTIQADLANSSAASKVLTIVRPPVVLVHDLWGDPADWNNFTPLINDSRFFIRRASYNGALQGNITASIPTYQTANIGMAKESSLGIAYNATILLTEIQQFVNDFRAGQNVAAAQADVVVHGMGGVLAREIVQMANYESPESYSQGTINKLITIGTPHLGTPLATALLRNENACIREILADASQFSFSSATVNGASVSGGIGDLQGDGFGGGLSPALARIQQRSDDSAQTALLAGSTSNSNVNSLDKVPGVAEFIRQSCPGSPLAASLTSPGWIGVFGDANDGMVSRFSQSAGRIFGPENAVYSGLIHSAAMEQLGFSPPGELDAGAPLVNAVINLLNSPIQSEAFKALP
jgi:hypothetical protein